MAKVALVRPAYSADIYRATYRGRFSPGSKQVPTPLQLMQIGATLVDRGHDVRIIDGEVENLGIDEIVDRVARERPDIVGATCTTPEYATAKAILEAVHRRLPEAITVVGGAHATHLPWELARSIDGIGHVVVFEGEKAMGAIADGDLTVLDDYATNARTLLASKGVAIDDPPDRTILLGEAQTTADLERLHPLRTSPHIDLRHYVYADPESGLVHTDSVETARGCPFACTFCSSARSGLGMRSVESVLEELDALDHRFRSLGVRGFVVFLDDTLTASRPRAVELFEQMLRRGYAMRYSGFTRANTIATERGDAEDREFAGLMKRVGFNTISFGIETGSEAINEAMKKGVTKDHYRRAYELLASVDFEERRGSFIVGHPHETAATVRESIDFALELGLHRVGVNIMTPYPGTEVYDTARRGDGLYFEPGAGDYGRYRRWGNAVVSTDELSPDALVWWHRRFLTEVYASTPALRHAAREVRRGNVSRFYHRPTTTALRHRARMAAARTWASPPAFDRPDHTGYDPSDFGPAHITKADCLAVLRDRYELRKTRVVGRLEIRQAAESVT